MSLDRLVVLDQARASDHRAGAPAGIRAGSVAGSGREPFRAAAGSLPVRLNQEWARLRTSSEAVNGLGRWAGLPRWADGLDLSGLDDLDAVVRHVQDTHRTVAERDKVLLGLLAMSQSGDRLAGRVVLQVMLPKAIRLAKSVASHEDWTEGADEAQAAVLAALWVAIATYPLERRPGRVTANLALDTLALTQRGHTGSSWQVHPVREQPCEDLSLLAEPVLDPAGPDDLTGPADAELMTVLAWGVRNGILRLDQARLMARVYGLDAHGDIHSTAPLVAETGLSWRVLRQRCHRLARRLGEAAIAAGISPVSPTAVAGSILTAA